MGPATLLPGALQCFAAVATPPAVQVEPVEPSTDKAPDSSRPFAGYDGGFFLQNADGSMKLVLEGLLQVQGKLFERGIERTSEFELERMRLEFSGELDRLYLFHVEPNFSEDDVELEEAWIGADLGAEGPRLILGRMKEPFSLEEMLPRKHLDYATFSIINQFAPAEDHGVTLLGSLAEDRLEYGLAVYNGSGGEDLNSDKDVALRAVLRPFAGDEGSLLRKFQFGGAVTVGRADEDVSGEELRTEARVPFLTFEPGSMLDGDRTRLGLEAAWLHGPFAAYAEAIAVSQEMENGASGADVAFRGGYVGASWVLTGEEKTFRGVHPDRPLKRNEDRSLSGIGAWQLAARLSRLSLDEDLVDAGLVLPSSYPDDVTTIDVGLNWIATWNARVKLHLLHTRYGNQITVDGEPRDTENALLVQFQIHF